MSTYASQLEGARHLLINAGKASTDEKILLIYDESTSNLVTFFEKVSQEQNLSLFTIKIDQNVRHGQEPDFEVLDQMMQSSLILALTEFSLAHTNARIQSNLSGSRFLSLPQYDPDLLGDQMILVDYEEQFDITKKFADIFTFGKSLQIRTEAGTNLEMNIENRIGNCCPGAVRYPGDLGSPPDIEANISPIEELSEGIAVIDASITTPELGVLSTPVILEISGGKVVRIDSLESEYVKKLEKIFESKNSPRRVLAELGVGLNPLARITGKMLSDEGTLSTAHFGFGSNFTVGGVNKVDFHLDFVMRDASIIVDDQVLMDRGKLL